MSTPRLELRELHTRFRVPGGDVDAVSGFSLRLAPGSTHAVIGESGCGKSVMALSILRLVAPPGEITGGEVRLDGRDLLGLRETEMRRVRGREIGMVFQEAASALDPLFSVGFQIEEAIRAREAVGRRAARAEAIELLARVGIPLPARRHRDPPHRLSGGMRQRALIAAALGGRPRVLLADEPTTALDVTTQARILDLLVDLQEERDMSLLLISHDLALVSEVAEEITVMYAGRVAESGPTGALLEAPRHPYTRALLGIARRVRGAEIPVIPGRVPDPRRQPDGCRFHPRCPLATERCRVEAPTPIALDGPHRVACHEAGGDS